MIDVDKLTKETIAKGGILSVLYFDLHGTSGGILQELGAGFVQKLLKEPGVVYAVGEIDEPLLSEEGKFYSTSVEVKMLTKDFISLLNLCTSHCPYSLEILRPNEMRFTVDKLHEILMHASATTFEYKKHIIEKMSTKQELEMYKLNIQQKIALGKKLSENKQK
ncbi:MAG: hypothetical protein WCT31_02870 [Candidatus Micrarchaeia archaeon]|jgi:hypothetical protein